ncbi:MULTISPECIES: hypothetical protein [unclassified Clostridium]|uniref:hypothetical protein n=1 Tax=unclassified Clostridium TaxID=2614128 RepID=UPI0025B8904A|nr:MULTISPECIES: hypothetical protein [unclassified Clostridium]
MRAEVIYDPFLTIDNKQTISKITIDISDRHQLVLSYLDSAKANNKLCEIKMIDKLGLCEISETIDKENFRELIQLVTSMYRQL